MFLRGAERGVVCWGTVRVLVLVALVLVLALGRQLGLRSTAIACLGALCSLLLLLLLANAATLSPLYILRATQPTPNSNPLQLLRGR